MSVVHPTPQKAISGLRFWTKVANCHCCGCARIFCVSCRLDYIAFANLDGRNKTYILQEDLAHIFAITVFEDFIYWTDWEKSSVERAHKYTGLQRKTIGSTIHRPMDIQVYHPFRQRSFKKDQVQCAENCRHSAVSVLQMSLRNRGV